jgi:hypothetical protein
MIATLSFDLLQYVIATICWGLFTRAQEKRDRADPLLIDDAPRWLNWPALACYWAKLALVCFGYALLFASLLKRVQFQ